VSSRFSEDFSVSAAGYCGNRHKYIFDSSVPAGYNIFDASEKGWANIESVAPLALRMRPRNLDEVVGQKHFLGPNKLLRRMLEADRLSSLLFYGPPGVGKTSLAAVIANYTKAEFHYLSAPAANVKDIRDIIGLATDRLAADGKRTVLFMDEIHRFNRAQQDVLLDDVEAGVLILIGATTENPFFSVNSPLISRSTVFRFEPLSAEDILYWLARMIAGGEDPRFIARRIAVCAAEDVGNADPTATVLAAAAVQISEFIGLPEAQLPLAQAALYVACAPKSNAAASAVWNAVADVKSQPTIPVPKHLKDSHYAAAKKLGFGADYKYPHNFKDGFVPQEYLSAENRKKYYRPKGIGYEKNIKCYLQKLQSLIQSNESVNRTDKKDD